MSELQTVKENLHKTRLLAEGNRIDDFTLTQGEVLLRLQRFSFTANNVTYAASGNTIGYWRFFPPRAQQDDIYGLIPVWGMAEVVASQCDDITPGERVYGYFPPAHFLRVTPGRINVHQFSDIAAHRADLPPIYNNYTRLDHEPGYDPSLDSHRALLQPLHVTAFLLCDKLEMEENYGASQVIIASASSKTAIGLAYGLTHQRAADTAKPQIVGVTSKGNVDFVTKLGLYDHIVTYDELAAIDKIDSTIVDMSGNSGYLGRLHNYLGAHMKQCVNVGLTHWDRLGDEDSDAAHIISERSEFFFAPSHAAYRSQQWGAEKFTAKMQAFLSGSIQHSQNWMRVIEEAGLEALAARYPDMVDGKMDPQDGLVITL